MLDVDRRDVVGEQHGLVREDVVLLLVFQGLGRNDAELQQARHERARPREGLDDGHPRIPQALTKRRAHRIVGTADDEVDDLDGCEDDVQALAHAWESLREEAIVERARSSPVEWCNRFVSFGLGYALSWSGVSSCPVGCGVSRDLVRMSRLR